MEIGSGSSPIRRLSISSVKQSPSPSSGVVSSELHSVHTKIYLCFACHVLNKHDRLQTKLQALSGLVTDDEVGFRRFCPQGMAPVPNVRLQEADSGEKSPCRDSKHSQILNRAYPGIKKTFTAVYKVAFGDR